MSKTETHYFNNWESINAIFAGNLPQNIKDASERLEVDFVTRNTWIKITAESDEKLKQGVEFLNELTRTYDSTLKPLDQQDFQQILHAFEEEKGNELQAFYSQKIKVSPKKREIIPRTKAQLEYVKNIREKDIVFCVGPAGTGKTYLAMALAVSELLEGKFSRIILTRPAIEAGENLGFLPGNLEEKIAPYLRPLYDALYDMLQFEEATALIEKSIIEIAPLAFMRGRTLNKAFIILDEAQNTTKDQMLMFLTRLGFNSHCVITGDPSQNDLPPSQESGLLHCSSVLQEINEIGFCEFSTQDVVRHPLVEKIIKAYQKHETDNKK